MCRPRRREIPVLFKSTFLASFEDREAYRQDCRHHDHHEVLVSIEATTKTGGAVTVGISPQHSTQEPVVYTCIVQEDIQ